LPSQRATAEQRHFIRQDFPRAASCGDWPKSTARPDLRLPSQRATAEQWRFIRQDSLRASLQGLCEQLRIYGAGKIQTYNRYGSDML